MALIDTPEINITDKTISTILMGGLGNNMFQIATLLSYAKDKGYDPLLGYWTNHQSESSKYSNLLQRNGRNQHFDPWGGHEMKNKDISLGDIFPNLPWFYGRPNAFEWWFDQRCAWDIDTGQGGLYYDLDNFVKTPTIFQGYFFNKLYWHHNRDYLLKMFEPDKKIIEYINHHYGNLFDNSISLHLRVAEPIDWYEVPKIPKDWIIDTIDKIDENSKILVFSNQVESARNFCESLGIPKGKFHYIDEDSFICMIMMSMCDKHILSNSTLSFWGAYLDKKQDNPYTYIHNTFFNYHPKTMIPYKSWNIT